MPILVIPSLRGRDDSQSAVADAVVGAFCLYSMPEDSPDVQAAVARRLPIVVVDEPRLDGHSFVGIDDRGGARLAAEHVLSLGHRRVGVISERLAEDGYRGPLTAERLARALYPIVAARNAGYRDALSGAGIAWQDVPGHECALNARDEGRRGAAALLERDPRLTALLAQTDQLALGALDHLRENGLTGVSVIGFDDIPAAAAADLSTVRQPLLEKGLAAGRLLVEPDGPREVLLDLELVPRSSTTPPRA